MVLVMASFRQVSSLLKQCGTQLLRVAWCDNASVIRAKAVYSSNLEQVFKDGVGLVKAAQVSLRFNILRTENIIIVLLCSMVNFVLAYMY